MLLYHEPFTCTLYCMHLFRILQPNFILISHCAKPSQIVNTNSTTKTNSSHITHQSNLHQLTVSRHSPPTSLAIPHRRSPPIITRSRCQPTLSRTSSIAYTTDHRSLIPKPQITPCPSYPADPILAHLHRADPSPHDPLASSPSRPVCVPRPSFQEMY
jgi:hypothetical protein